MTWPEGPLQHRRCQSGIRCRQVASRFINACPSLYNVCVDAYEKTGPGRWFGRFVLSGSVEPSS